MNQTNTGRDRDTKPNGGMSSSPVAAHPFTLRSDAMTAKEKKDIDDAIAQADVMVELKDAGLRGLPLILATKTIQYRGWYGYKKVETGEKVFVY